MRRFAPSAVIGAGLLLIAGGNEAQERASAPETAQLTEWKNCIFSKARRYAKTTDSAEVVARISALACRPERRRYLERLSASGNDSAKAFQTVEQLERYFVEDAEVAVMEQRAPN